MLVRNEYDGKGRVWEQTTEEGDVVTLDFDFAPGQTKVTYAGSGDEHIFSYNENGEVIGVEDPYGQPIERDFDDGQPAGFVTRRAAEYHNEYDTKGRLRRRLHPNPETGLLGYAEEVFTYVGDSDPNSTDTRVKTYTYNAMGLVETVTVEGTPPETTTYGYDGAGRVRTIQGPIPEHDPVVYEYWPTGELKSVTDEEQHTTAYEYERGATDTNVCAMLGCFVPSSGSPTPPCPGCGVRAWRRRVLTSARLLVG